jgi:HTH-type transcriptional regulator/antitoxin HigA
MNTKARSSLVPAPEPDYAIPPGETLRERLEELGMSQADLARRTGLTPKHVNQVLKGAASLSADVALRLEYATGTPTKWWLRLEADYRAVQTRLARSSMVSSDLAWVESMPVKSLVGVGAIPEGPSEPTQRLRQLLRFFGVASVDAYQRVWHEPAAAFRQSRAFTVHESAVTSWLRLGELAAQLAPAPEPYDPVRLRASLPRLRALTREPIIAAMNALVEECRLSGVTVVFVPEIPGARAYGATRWLGAGRRPIIQLSLRGKTDDKLWFTVFHEIAHVLLHDRKTVYIESDEDSGSGEGRVARDEAEANEFAWSHLIPLAEQGRLEDLVSVEDALDFAETIGIGPSLVAARLQRDGLWGYRQGTRMKRPVDFDSLTAAGAEDSERARRRRSRRLPGSSP